MSAGSHSIANLDLVGGSPCLDFVNTVNSRLMTERDYLAGYGDLITWCRHADLLTAPQAASLVALAGQHPRAAVGAFRRARELRDTIYAVFGAISAGRTPTAAHVASLGAAYAAAMAQVRIVAPKQGSAALGYRESWPADRDLNAPGWLIAYAAGRLLLATGDIDHIKACPGCGWLFVDTSRNHRRRWCTMDVCGSRDKMRRYYRSRRATG